MKRWIPLIIFAGLAFFFYRGLYLHPHDVPSPFIGKPAPAFDLPVVGHPGETFSPSQNLGKVWLLNVWAPWCVSCRDEHPELLKLAGEGVLIYGLNWQDKDHQAAALLASIGDPYVKVGDDQSGQAGIDWGVTGTPETYVVDKKGIIRYKQIGVITDAVWRNKLAPLLKELNQ